MKDEKTCERKMIKFAIEWKTDWKETEEWDYQDCTTEYLCRYGIQVRQTFPTLYRVTCNTMAIGLKSLLNDRDAMANIVQII